MKISIVTTLIYFASCLAQVCTSFVVVPTTASSSSSSSSSSAAVLTSRRKTKTKSSSLREKERLQERPHATDLRCCDKDLSCHGKLQRRCRRRFLEDVLAFTACVGVTFGSSSSPSSKANATTKRSQTIFEAGKDLTLDEARARFREGQESLDYLLKHYDEIRAGGGDNVRRYLGTVGTTSGLYGIAKVMKTLQQGLEDNVVVEYNETMEELNTALVGADAAAYTTIFTETRKEQYFQDAKLEIERAIQSMKEIAKQADIVR